MGVFYFLFFGFGEIFTTIWLRRGQAAYLLRLIRATCALVNAKE